MSIRRCLLTFLIGASFNLSAADPSPEAIRRGKVQFQQACGFCHGEDATGSRGPDLIRSAALSHDQNGDVIGPIVKNGRPDKGMPAQPMSDAQISDIAAFLHAQALAALHSASVPPDYPVEKLLTGNAAAGKAYFLGAGGCGSCHSTTADLAGVATKYKPIDLEARFLYPRGRSATPAVTVTLASGRQISGKLIRMDEFNVSLREANGWYHSWPLGKVKVEVKDPIEAHRALLYKYTDADVHNLFAYLETLK
jgi:cytochrome c oxidase cbb3-type subunit 3